MKLIIALIVVIFVKTNTIQAQVNYEFPIVKKENFNSISKFKDDFPFQIGVEGGIPVKILGENFFTSGIFAYLNINLKSKIVFLKIEYANFWLNKDLEEYTIPYASFGITSQIVVISKTSKIYLDFGYGLFSSKKYLGGGVKVAISYKQSLNDLVSILANIKIPVIRESWNDEFYFNPFLTIGVQLF